MIPLPAVFLSFDDEFLQAWEKLLPGLESAAARVTLYPSNLESFGKREWDILRRFRDAGHSIGTHGLRHVDAGRTIAGIGATEFMKTEIDPVFEAYAAERLPAPRHYAYPHGDRTTDSDDVLLRRFATIRAAVLDPTELGLAYALKLYSAVDLKRFRIFYGLHFGRDPLGPSPYKEILYCATKAEAAVFFFFHDTAPDPQPRRLAWLLDKKHRFAISFLSMDEIR